MRFSRSSQTSFSRVIIITSGVIVASMLMPQACFAESELAGHLQAANPVTIDNLLAKTPGTKALSVHKPRTSEQPPEASANDEIVVRARLPKSKRIAVKNFNAVAQLYKVKRSSARIQSISLALSAIDGIITSRCVVSGMCRELNPLLGRAPSPFKIFGLKGAVGATQWHQRVKLSDKDPYAARSHAYVELAQNILITASTLVTGL